MPTNINIEYKDGSKESTSASNNTVDVIVNRTAENPDLPFVKIVDTSQITKQLSEVLFYKPLNISDGENLNYEDWGISFGENGRAIISPSNNIASETDIKSVIISRQEKSNRF